MMKALSSVLAISLLAFVPQSGTQGQKGPKPPEVGKAAPTLRLNDHTGNAVSVGGESDHWTALAFFPKALTPG